MHAWTSVDNPHRELTFDECDLLGLDGTGRDLDPRFPYTLMHLTLHQLEVLFEHATAKSYHARDVADMVAAWNLTYALLHGEGVVIE